MKTLIEIKAILNAVAAVIPTQLGDMVRDCVREIESPPSGIVPRISSLEASYCLENQKIKAIKALRERTGMGLLDAKHLIEFWIGQGEYTLRQML